MSRDILANEKAFLGALLRSPNSFWAVNDIVSADMFSQPHFRDIFTAIRDVSERGKIVSTTALTAHLPEEYADAGPTIGIIEALKASAEDAGSPQDYADFIASNAAVKRLDALGDWLRKEIKKPDASAEDIAAAAAIRLSEITNVASPLRPQKLGELVNLIRPHEGDGPDAVGIETGLVPLDEILGSILPGDLGCILASQGDGKSALAAQIGVHIAKQGLPVLYVQLEMSQDQMAAREVAAESGIPVSKIDERSFDEYEWNKVRDAQQELQKPLFYILDAEEITIRQIKAQALSMMRSMGLALLVIDQLDKLQSEGKYRDRFERFAELTRDLKRMAKSLKVPVIVLAQRTRGAQRRDDATPSTLDADAVSLDRDSDWIIALWQKASHLRLNPPDEKLGKEARSNWEIQLQQAEGVANIMMLKHRRRKAHQPRTIEFEGATMRFVQAM